MTFDTHTGLLTRTWSCPAGEALRAVAGRGIRGTSATWLAQRRKDGIAASPCLAGRSTSQVSDRPPAAVPPRRCPIVNRTQALVLSFFLMALGSLVVIRAAAPDVYDQALRFPPSWPRWAGIAFLLALAAFIALLAVGVLRRWHWTFWLILVAFLAGVLRVPVAILQLTGILRTSVPSWYVVFQGLIGLVQLAIGLAMLAGYRRSGLWGAG